MNEQLEEQHPLIPLFLKKGSKDYKYKMLSLILGEIESNGYFISTKKKMVSLGKSPDTFARNIGYLLNYGILIKLQKGEYAKGEGFVEVNKKEKDRTEAIEEASTIECNNTLFYHEQTDPVLKILLPYIASKEEGVHIEDKVFLSILNEKTPREVLKKPYKDKLISFDQETKVFTVTDKYNMEFPRGTNVNGKWKNNGWQTIPVKHIVENRPVADKIILQAKRNREEDGNSKFYYSCDSFKKCIGGNNLSHKSICDRLKIQWFQEKGSIIKGKTFTGKVENPQLPVKKGMKSVSPLNYGQL
jgi:hypothetical protein